MKGDGLGAEGWADEDDDEERYLTQLSCHPKSACGQPGDYWRLPNPDRASEFIGCFWVAFDAVGRQVGRIFHG